MYETSNNELQDILMCESFFDDFATSNNLNNNSNTTQPPSAALSEFEAQIRVMLEADNNDLGNIQQNFPNNSIQDSNDFQYSDNPLFHSPDTDILASLSPSSDSFLNSYNSFDDISSLSDTPSPPQFNLQDFIVSPNDSIIQGSMEDPNFELLTSNEDFSNTKKRDNSHFDHKSISPDRSLKKKRNGGISKSIKKSSVPSKDDLVKHILEQFVRDEPTLASNMLEKFIKGNSNSGMSHNDGTAQSIVVPNSPIPSDLSSPDYDSILTSEQDEQDALNQTVNPSEPNFMPLFVNNDSSTASLQSHQNKQRKVAHNAIERRYRNNINDRINDLKNVVPALCHLKNKDSKDDDDIEEIDGIPAATKLSKATILGKATEYITYLKDNNQKMKRENEMIKKLIEAIPGGIEIYNTYIAEQPVGCDESNNGSTEGSPGSSLPSSPDNQVYIDYDTQPTPPIGNAGSRALMSLFMCMTFTSPSSYITQTHPDDHHHEGRVLTNKLTPELNVSDGTFTIDLWYIIRIVTFLLCLTYILRPSLFSSQPRRLRNSRSIIASVLSAKTKDSKVLYKSFSNLSNGLPVNTFEIIIGLFSEFIKFFLRRFIRWDITSGSLTNHEERLLEVALWGRVGEVELCGGNDNVSRLSILYNCLRTINLLESTYTTGKFAHLNSSRIYANAALQSYIGLSSFPFLAKKAVSHFWDLANKEKVRNSDSEEKWLEIALSSDQRSEIWKGTVDRINDHIFKKTNEEKSNIELMKNITVPLTLMTDVQAMSYLKQVFYNFISIKFNRKIRLSRNQQSFSFLGLVRNTTSNSFTHWYSLVGCCIEAFSLGHTALGEKLVNRLRDRPTGENNYDKQIIAMGLLSYALLMHGKLEASIRCANKASVDLTKRKEQRNGDSDEKLELSDDYSCELEQDIHYLAEFCVGWIVLEVKILGWKIIEGLSSASKNSMKSSDENETMKSPSDATMTTSTTTKSTLTNKLPNKLPYLLNNERIQNAIILWTRHLRKLSNNPVFDNTAGVREIFIKKLVILERVVIGDQDFSDDDLYSPDEESDNQQHNRDIITNNTSQSLSESENRAIKSWNVLKRM